MVSDEWVEVVKVPAATKDGDAVSDSPDIDHFLPCAVLGWGLDAKFHIEAPFREVIMLAKNSVSFRIMWIDLRQFLGVGRLFGRGD